VVLYGESNNSQPMPFGFSKYHGHEDARILNGGLEKWQLEKRELTKSVPKITPSRYRPKKHDESMRVFKEYILESIVEMIGFS